MTQALIERISKERMQSITEVAECLVDISIGVVEPHLSQQPRKLIIVW